MLVDEPVVVEILKRLRNEGFSRHNAAHAIGSILADQVYNVLKREQPDAGIVGAANLQMEPTRPTVCAIISLRARGSFGTLAELEQHGSARMRQR